ncbi:ATP-grasp domain-containing protein [Herbidospora cretacea]|uniref:ATP-grasp domain-containing protein n=1 Tax=Herbidospora cretacea TaxID=28444 RepID=UPI000774C186|nr:ATP-grasp domain-containing protein [Herbidospora cretacea]
MTGGGTTSAGTVVLIGGRAHREFSLLHELGYRILYLDRRVPFSCVTWADLPFDVDVDDWDAVFELVKHQLGGHPPAAILTHVEPRIPLMAHLSELLLDTPRGLSVETAWNCHDKWLTRNRLREHGVPVPGFGLADSAEEAIQIAAEIGLPVVVKPRDEAGAFGVRRCLTLPEVREAATAILSESGSGTRTGVLVEEYIDGPEYAVQTLTRGGRTQVLSIFLQHMTDPPVFVELGYEHPSGLGESAELSLRETTVAALQALGVTDWISHTQVRRGPDGFRVVEVNARRPGGRLVEMTEAVSGVDMTLAACQLALGLPVTSGRPKATHALYSSIVFDRPGVVTYRTGIDVAPFSGTLPPIVELEIPPGDPVQAAAHPEGGVYGRIVAFGDSAAEAGEGVRGIREALDLQVTELEDLAWEVADSREYKSCC